MGYMYSISAGCLLRRISTGNFSVARLLFLPLPPPSDPSNQTGPSVSLFPSDPPIPSPSINSPVNMDSWPPL